jgi:hypothetical protein
MPASQSRTIHFAALAALGVLCLLLQSDPLPVSAHVNSSRLASLPHTTLWAWERPEDLTTINPRTTAIAFLDRTILIGPPSASPNVIVQPRRQSLAVPNAAKLIAVVRIEAPPGMIPSDNQRQKALAALADSASQPGISAFQVDFDATRSQRPFYAALLKELRSQMPSGLPLSITALASWCSYDDWIAALPIDEAVPMLFRMEPDRRRAPPDSPWFQIREPLCQGSLGLSTREPWPLETREALKPSRRIYLFADRGWHTDLSTLTDRNLP